MKCTQTPPSMSSLPLSFLLAAVLFVYVSAAAVSLCPATPACECRRIQSRSFVICSQVRDPRELGESVPRFPPSSQSHSHGGASKLLPWVRLVDSNIPVLGPRAFGGLRAQGLQINASNLSVIADEAFAGMEELRALALQDNHLPRVPVESLARLPHLELLSLAGNRIAQIRQGDLVNLHQLRYLSLAENVINGIEGGSLPTSLVHLALGSNNLNSIGNALKASPGSAMAFPFLEWLLLSNNSLRSFHDELHGLPSLQLLILNYNQLDNIHGAFKGLTRLRSLYLEHNRLRGVDGVFDQLVELQQLSLHHNSISRLGKLGYTPSLNTLDLSNNQIKHIQGDAFLQTSNLTRLNLSDNSLRRIPVHALAPLEHLVVFDLSRNHLQSLDGIEQLNLTILKNLFVSGNELESLPPNLKDHLPSLLVLDLSYNLFTKLHVESFMGLNLRSLRVQGNPLRCNLDTRQVLDSMDASAIDGKPRCSNAILPASTEMDDD